MTSEPSLLTGPPAASAVTWFTSPPVQVPLPSVSKFWLSAVKIPPVRGPRHTRQVPTSMAEDERESRMYGTKNAPSSPPTSLPRTTKLNVLLLQLTPAVH